MSEILAIVILAVILLVGVAVFLLIGYLPGLIAQRRGHPSAAAIRICGLVGLLFWPCWLVALIWAYTAPHRSALPDEPDSAPAPALMCDGCGRALVLSQTRQIGARLFCPQCAALLDAGPRATPGDPADDL
jgi:hypothetical protein